MNEQIEIRINELHTATVDQVDSDLNHPKWNILKRGDNYYARYEPTTDGYRERYLMHRVIMERVLNRPLAKGEVVDHIDGNGLNNSRSNLRLASVSNNGGNSKRPKTNTSGYKGVTFHKGRNKWRSQIKVNQKNMHLGYFVSIEDAKDAYQDAAKFYFGEFARFE